MSLIFKIGTKLTEDATKWFEIRSFGMIMILCLVHNTPGPHCIRKPPAGGATVVIPSLISHDTVYPSPGPFSHLSHVFAASPGKQGMNIHFKHDSEVFLMLIWRRVVWDGLPALKGGLIDLKGGYFSHRFIWKNWISGVSTFKNWFMDLTGTVQRKDMLM